MNPKVMRFDRFELQLAERRLLRDGAEVPLRAKAFDLLVVLAERAGHLVTKDELLELVWPGLVVEENNIAAQVVALRKALASELIVTVPGRGYRFQAAPQATIGPGPAKGAQAISLVPGPLAPAALFGREADRARLSAAIALPGCVTLVGPGGVGKTALAAATSGDWDNRATLTQSPSIWLDLAPLTDGSQILPGLFRAIGVELSDQEAATALAQALGEWPRLLVLDNAEHLVETVARVVPLLTTAAPALHVLVTSQLALAIQGERVERIDPLELPISAASDAQALQTGAVAMFVDRVRNADARYQFGPESWPIVRQLCTDLDGLPLALEMAAARVPLMGLRQVRDALGERFAMLRNTRRDKPGRHRTLESALDWSHELLSPEEQRMFHALGIFVGGFTLDLAISVAAEPDTDRWDAIDQIAALVDRSLVSGNHDDPPRYTLLETMRSYALARLVATGAEAAVRKRQSAALCTLLRQGNDALRDEGGNALRSQGVKEMNNVREAIAWSRLHDPQIAIDLAVQAAHLALFTPWRLDAAQWLAACEPLLDAVSPAKQALWWRHFAAQMLFRGSPRAVEAGKKAVACYREIGDEEGLFWSLVPLVRATLTAGDANVVEWTDELKELAQRHPEWPARARAAALGTQALASEGRGDFALSLRQRMEELEVARAGGLDGTIDGAETSIAEMLARLGRYDEALARIRAHLARVRGKESFNLAHIHLGLVDVLLRAGRGQEALAEAEAALYVCRQHGMPEMSDIAALIAAQTGRPHTAALLLGHARRTFAALGGALVDSPEVAYTRTLALIRDALSHSSLERLIERGMSLDERAADRLLFATEDAEDLG